MGKVFVGTSGWNYKHWANGTFYPRGLGQKNWLSFYAGKFSTVELNNTFYRLPSEENFAHWARTVPPEFKFAAKASRFITHLKRLREPEESVHLFLSRLSRLERKRGPVLFQLPPQMAADTWRLKELRRALKGRKGLRVALEFRHESWLTDDVYEFVERAGWTICLADAPKFDRVVPVLGPFGYVRRHGKTGRDDPCYSDRDLSRDAEFVTNLAERGRDVYVYFNNDAEGCAPKNALTLITKIPDRYVANVPAEGL